MSNIETTTFQDLQPGGDVVTDSFQSESNNSGRPVRNRKQLTRMNISSKKGNTYDLALVQAICLAQIAEVVKGKRFSLNRRIKLWGERGWSAVEAELSQIHNRAVFEPQDPSVLTWEEKMQALESHFFLEQKKNDEIKARNVGGGNK